MTGGGKILTGVILALVLAVNSAATQADTGLELLQQLNEFPHARLLDLEQEEVLDYEVGLGAIQKIGGAWRFKDSETFQRPGQQLHVADRRWFHLDRGHGRPGQRGRTA